MSDDDEAKAACLADALKHGEKLSDVAAIYICQGEPRCDYKGDGPPRENCPWCVKIRSDDLRDPDDIIAEMKRMQS